jgi:hypothetical protein
MMKGVIKKTLTGLAFHAATGKSVGQALPSEDNLAVAFSH